VLAGKLKPVWRSDCEALAGKSTLNRLELTPKRHAAKYHKIHCDGAKVDALRSPRGRQAAGHRLSACPPPP
jgi:hypothetical protein